MRKYSAFIALIFCLSGLSFASVNGTVTLDSVPKAISPNGDGLYDKTRFIISVDVGKIKTWTLDIKNEKGEPIKSFVGEGTIPVNLEWDGTDSKNVVVPDGKYACVMTVDGKYPAQSNQLWINVDTEPPLVSMSVSTYCITLNSNGTGNFIDISFVAEDPTGFSLWQMSIQNLQGIDVVSRKGTTDVIKKFRWDGRDDYYKTFVPSSEYKINFSVLDAVGNKAEAEPVELSVVRQEDEILETKKIPANDSQKLLVIKLASSVLFDSDKAKLKKSAYSAIKKVAKIIQKYPKNKCLVEGHTDSLGSKAYNKRLSEKRAQAVADMLVSKYGIAAGRLKVTGYGKEKPIADNKTARGREQNRRVEIIIVKK